MGGGRKKFMSSIGGVRSKSAMAQSGIYTMHKGQSILFGITINNI